MAINPKPFLRVIQIWGVEEPASTAFSFILFLLASFGLWRLWIIQSERNTDAEKTRVRVWMNAVGLWMFAYFSSTLFHIKETKLTERMDYFGAFASLIFSTWIAVTRIFPPNMHSSLAILFTVLPLWHIAFMTFIKFDYGWHVKLCICIGCLHFISWMFWCFLNPSRPYRMYIILNHLTTLVSLPLELYDFRPLWGHFDAHSLWHCAGIVTTWFWLMFAWSDAQYETKQIKQARQL
eukprot:c7945_g1_i1.p1 GENE.c7945_g1_i1~~c7945_g1_i1.p1  ORF type:complete len:246 (-),score=33.76 c7945_g1_i1:295-1002(-)